MPLYEYSCRKCSRRFEVLVFGHERPACPKCHGRNLERLFSTFAVSGAERKSESDSMAGFGGSDFGDDSDPAGDSGFGSGSDFGGDAGFGGEDAAGGDGESAGIPGADDDPGGSDSWDAD